DRSLADRLAGDPRCLGAERERRVELLRPLGVEAARDEVPPGEVARERRAVARDRRRLLPLAERDAPHEEVGAVELVTEEQRRNRGAGRFVVRRELFDREGARGVLVERARGERGITRTRSLESPVDEVGVGERLLRAIARVQSFERLVIISSPRVAA